MSDSAPAMAAGTRPVAAPLAVDARAVEVGLSAGFAVRIADLAVAPGEVWVLDAPSGAGKSTALALIGGALMGTAAGASPRLRLFGHDRFGGPGFGSDTADPAEIAFVLQMGGLIPFLDIRRNIRLPLRLKGRSPDPAWEAALVARLGLEELLHRLPETLSVGQRQRASIARAFLARPRVLLLDEPTSALDPDNAARVEDLLQALCTQTGAAALIAAHGGRAGSFGCAARIAFATRQEGERLVSVFWNRGPAP